MVTPFSISECPHEILVTILSHLSGDAKYAQTLGTLAVVSKKFKKATEADILWKKVADNYSIRIRKTGSLDIKAQVKASVSISHGLAKMLFSRINNSASGKKKATYVKELCASLKGCTLANPHALDSSATKPVIDVTDESILFSIEDLVNDPKIELSNTEIHLLLLHLITALKNTEDSKLIDQIAASFFRIGAFLIDSSKTELLQDVIDGVVKLGVASKVVRSSCVYVELNPLIMSSVDVTDSLRKIVQETPSIESLDVSLYDNFRETADLRTYINEWQKIDSTKLNKLTDEEWERIDYIKHLKIAKHIMDQAREWPDPAEVLGGICNRFSYDRGGAIARFSPLFELYIAEYKRLKSS